MKEELKQDIVQAAHAYMQEHGISANDFARRSGINPSYLSNMLRGIFKVSVNGKDVDIIDRWFKKMADAADFKLEAVRWETVITTQFEEGIHYLKTAKENNLCGILIAETGAGKTYLINRFCIAHPAYTYRITVSSIDSMNDILEDMCSAVGVPAPSGPKKKLDSIIKALLRAKSLGEDIIMIIDEAENLKIDVIRMLKALYDKLAEHCSIVLIGTPELLTKLDYLTNRGHSGMPQFYRRFKAGIRTLPPVVKNFRPFFEKYVEDKSLRLLLNSLCDNYGELHDRLFPVMKEAHDSGEPLTEQLFRRYYNMPS